MAKMAAVLLRDLEKESPPMVTIPPGSYCVQCGIALPRQGYKAPKWGSVSRWEAFDGMAKPGGMFLCATCFVLVQLFQKNEVKIPNSDKPRIIARENFGNGWHRVIEGEPIFEHFPSLGDLKKDSAYWKILHAAIFEPRAQVWVIMQKSTQVNVSPYIAYTPANSRYLSLLIHHHGPHVARLRRQVLWDAVVGITAQTAASAAKDRTRTKKSALAALPHADLRIVTEVLMPMAPYPGPATQASSKEDSHS